MKLYGYIRELTVFLGFLVGLVASSVIIFGRLFRGYRNNYGLAWALIFFVLVLFQVSTLLMNRWGMVPYLIYVISALPALALMIKDRWFRALITAVAAILIALAPVVKWGFSPIAFPTAHDVHEALFISRHMNPQTGICASGVHELLGFYYWLNT
jgi:hypothetical protein